MELDMPKTQLDVIRLRAVPMNVERLMKRPMAEVHNYVSEVVPLLRLYGNYKHAFVEGLKRTPGNFYAVANFNLVDVEPEWCKHQLNLFDMKIARLLLKRNWSKRPNSERPQWIAVPEQASYLHYNMLWDVPLEHHEAFYREAPGIWRGMIPAGQFHIQRIGDDPGEGIATRLYSAKTFHPRWTVENTIMSRELRGKK
jgi:hypothetical protein